MPDVGSMEYTMPLLFISYRRADCPDTVKLIHERLKRRLPRWEIFYDHESIPLGEQFPERLQAKVAGSLARAQGCRHRSRPRGSAARA